MSELKPPPKVVVAKRGDDYAKLASRLGVDEQALIKVNPNAYKVSAGAAYNVPSRSMAGETPKQKSDRQLSQLRESVLAPLREFDPVRYGWRGGERVRLGGTVKGNPAKISDADLRSGIEMLGKQPFIGKNVYDTQGMGTATTSRGPAPQKQYQTARETMVSEITKWPSFPGEDIAEIKLDRPEYWTNIGASQAVKSRIEDYMQQFVTDTGEIDWEAAQRKDPDILDTLVRLGYKEPSDITMPDYTDGQGYGGYYYPTPSYYGGGGRGRGVIGEGRIRSRRPTLGLVSWSGM